jgi:hypothetical protein
MLSIMMKLAAARPVPREALQTVYQFLSMPPARRHHPSFRVASKLHQMGRLRKRTADYLARHKAGTKVKGRENSSRKGAKTQRKQRPK